MVATSRDFIYKNKSENIILMSNGKKLSRNAAEWIFLMKEAKSVGLSIKDSRKFIVQNQKKPLSR